MVSRLGKDRSYTVCLVGDMSLAIAQFHDFMLETRSWSAHWDCDLLLGDTNNSVGRISMARTVTDPVEVS